MFIKKSFANEIAQSMERELIDGSINKLAEKEAKLVKAADYLNAAAAIFDEEGLEIYAEVTTNILEVLAGKKKKKKKAKKPKTEKAELTSEKMVENLKTKGWMFDEGAADDGSMDENCAMCGSVKKPKMDQNLAKDEKKQKEKEMYEILQDFKNNSGNDDFEDEDDFDLEVHDPRVDSFSEEDIHPNYKMPSHPFESHEYNNDVGEPFDPIQHKGSTYRDPWAQYGDYDDD